MENYKVKQILPSHAEHLSKFKEKYIDNLFKTDTLIVQPKFDGERMLIHFNNEEIYTTSRRVNKDGYYMENQDKLPKLTSLKIPYSFENKPIGYTVIDCECYAKNWNEIVGVLHSLPERAIELQKEVDVKFAVFDILFFDGCDLRDIPYMDRLSILIDFINILKEYNDASFIDITPTKPIKKEEIEKEMESALNEGYEGIVIKPLSKFYYDKGALIKVKKFETVDLVIMDYQPGEGKYEGLIGAVIVGYYDEATDSLVKVAKVNCGTDEERRNWTANWNNMLGKVMEVKCQEITDKSLRHPVYIRLRDDKSYKMCTKDTIFK